MEHIGIPGSEKKGGIIGRIHTIHPLSGDTFYLRILLHHNHCKGAKSFENLKVVNGVLCDSYKDVCTHLCLLHDDGEWNIAMHKATLSYLPAATRNLFIIWLQFCEPSNPKQLFDTHLLAMNDDFKQKYPSASEEQITACVLQDLQQRLNYAGLSLESFNLPTFQSNLLQEMLTQHNMPNDMSVVPNIMQEELAFDLEQTQVFANARLLMLTPSQRLFHDAVMQSIPNGEDGMFFLDARGGTGKTFTLNTLLASQRTIQHND